VNQFYRCCSPWGAGSFGPSARWLEDTPVDFAQNHYAATEPGSWAMSLLVPGHELWTFDQAENMLVGWGADNLNPPALLDHPVFTWFCKGASGEKSSREFWLFEFLEDHPTSRNDGKCFKMRLGVFEGRPNQARRNPVDFVRGPTAKPLGIGLHLYRGGSGLVALVPLNTWH